MRKALLLMTLLSGCLDSPLPIPGASERYSCRVLWSCPSWGEGAPVFRGEAHSCSDSREAAEGTALDWADSEPDPGFPCEAGYTIDVTCEADYPCVEGI